MSGEALLSLRALSAGYHGQAIVHEASFDIEAGSVVALLGANGAGKTTLLKTAIGLLPRIDGHCLLASNEISLLSTRERARRVAWVPQLADTAWRYTVRELVSQGRYAHLGAFASYGLADEQAVNQALSTMDLSALESRTMQELSGGEARRVLIARALAQDTPLLALDEPAAHLDPGRQVELMELLRSIAADGKGVLVSVHDVNAARRFADRVILIDHQGLAHFGRPDEVLSTTRLSLAFDTEFLEGSHHQYGTFLLPIARLRPPPADGASNDA